MPQIHKLNFNKILMPDSRQLILICFIYDFILKFNVSFQENIYQPV